MKSINQSINQWDLYSALFKNHKIYTKALHKKNIYNQTHESIDEIQLLVMYTSSNRWCFKSFLKMSMDPEHLICSGN